MGMPKLWGKDNGGAQGFVFSHVKTIYYNWAQRILLKDKLDAMDELITQNAETIAERLVTNEALNEALSSYVSKTMMSGQQVNDSNKVPTSALAYAMAQNITANKNNITTNKNNVATLKTQLEFKTFLNDNNETKADLINFFKSCSFGQSVRIFDKTGNLTSGNSGNYIGTVTMFNGDQITAVLVNHWNGMLYSMSYSTNTGMIWKKYVTT